MKKIVLVLSSLLVFTACSLKNEYGIAAYTKPKNANDSLRADTLNTDYAVYTFSNVDSRKLMEVAGDTLQNEKYNDGAKIVQRKSYNRSGAIAGWQSWYVIYNSTSKGIKYYYIRNVFSGKMLDAQSSAINAQLQQSAQLNTGVDEQLWSLQRIGNTQNYRIINKANGLAVENSKKSVDSIPVVLQTLNDSAVQRWTLSLQPAVTYRDDQVVGFFNRNNPSLGSVAFDEGLSIPLEWGANKGKDLWITQDAWDGSALQSNNKFKCTDFFQYRNSVMIQPSRTDWNPNDTKNMTRVGSLQNRPKQIFDIIPNTEWAWPSAGVEIGNHVYVQCGEGNGLGPIVSQSLYDLTEAPNYLWSVKRTTPAGMTNEVQINYSAGMVKDTVAGYVYVFGTMATSFGYTLNVYVARFPITDPMTWTFWNGSSWATTPDSGNEASIASELGTAYVTYVKGKYVLVTMDQGFNCGDATRNIYVATSNSPTGAFTSRKEVYTITEYLYGSYARYYTVSIHPEFDNGHNELLVTYCLNFSGCAVNYCVNGFIDPYFYRVKGIRIPYNVIGL
ncbi:RICIN domain-containing protein [Arachidicoccus soli]|uniref:Ricin B lectin domain-containing protein n=1 Tax=Arachidicoccus soli TaxID=2341117 RepID=A0A386HNJ8_9BACT|nr:RICIN domain-containing protein [Arachidicoccus soli]AYD47497.1 hypothetical protein D6B99_07705 [Arachidicoccus soli]